MGQRSRTISMLVGVVVALAGCGQADTPLCHATLPKTQTGPDPGMMLVTAGPFFQGCNTAVDKLCDMDESPGRCVTLSGYEIDKTEVTQAAYAACVAAGKCGAPQTMPGCPLSPASVPNQPAVCILWSDAINYCAFVGKRLPTEAEWEKAARGTDGRLYPWGNDAPSCQRANYSSCTAMLKDVGTTSGDVSPYGVKDMAGNAAEWVNDWYLPNYYSTAPSQDPQGPADGSIRVYRGSDFLDDATFLRTSYRGNSPPTIPEGNVGFRCAKSVN